MNSGYTEEALAWHNWLPRGGGSPDLMTAYGIRGQRRLLEWKPAGSTAMKAQSPSASATQHAQLQHDSRRADRRPASAYGKARSTRSWSMECAVIHLAISGTGPTHRERRGEAGTMSCRKDDPGAFDRGIKSGRNSAWRRWRNGACCATDPRRRLRRGFDPEINSFVNPRLQNVDASLLLLVVSAAETWRIRARLPRSSAFDARWCCGTTPRGH
jgi:hypothetical protein